MLLDDIIVFKLKFLNLLFNDVVKLIFSLGNLVFGFSDFKIFVVNVFFDINVSLYRFVDFIFFNLYKWLVIFFLNCIVVYVLI